MKQVIIKICNASACFFIGRAVLKIMHGRSYVRAINYHDTPFDFEKNLERQLQFYQQHFDNCSESDLVNFLKRGLWDKDKPGLIISFDDGLYSNYSVAAPLLERYGFHGFFFVPTALIGPQEDLSSATRPAPGDHDIIVHGSEGLLKRGFMNWGELRDLNNRGHAVGVHTRHHIRLTDKLDDITLVDEILMAGQELETNLGKPAESFCWVGGEEWSYGREADRKIKSSGYHFAFMTNLAPIVAETNPFRLQRTNIESDWPIENVRFYLSGIMDIAYTLKRRRLAAHLSVQ